MTSYGKKAFNFYPPRKKKLINKNQLNNIYIGNYVNRKKKKKKVLLYDILKNDSQNKNKGDKKMFFKNK